MLGRDGVHDQLGHISLPTLVIVGEEDVAIVPAKAERISHNIAGSRLIRIARAGHTSTVEEPEAANAALDGFLADIRQPDACLAGVDDTIDRNIFPVGSDINPCEHAKRLYFDGENGQKRIRA